MRQEDCGGDSTYVEEQLRWKQNARDVNAKSQLIRLEPAEHQADHLRRKDFGGNDSDPEDRGHDGDDDRESLLCVLFTLFSQESCVDGDKGDGGGTAGSEIVDPIRDGKTGVVGVGDRRGPECPSYVPLAEKSHYARQHDGGD